MPQRMGDTISPAISSGVRPGKNEMIGRVDQILAPEVLRSAEANCSKCSETPRETPLPKAVLIIYRILYDVICITFSSSINLIILSIFITTLIAGS